MRVGYDVDGVGHIFSAGFYDHMVHEGVESLWKSGPTPHPYWNWYHDYNWSDQEFVEFCNRAADHGCLFQGHVREGYKESIEEVRAMGHYIVIVTDRPFGSNPEVSKELTYKWFEDEDIKYDSIIFSSDKTVGNTDFFIDDKIENYDALRSAGMNAVLINRAWNLDNDDRFRVDSMQEYTDIIRQATYSVV